MLAEALVRGLSASRLRSDWRYGCLLGLFFKNEFFALELCAAKLIKTADLLPFSLLYESWMECVQSDIITRVAEPLEYVLLQVVQVFRLNLAAILYIELNYAHNDFDSFRIISKLLAHF